MSKRVPYIPFFFLLTNKFRNLSPLFITTINLWIAGGDKLKEASAALLFAARTRIVPNEPRKTYTLPIPALQKKEATGIAWKLAVILVSNSNLFFKKKRFWNVIETHDLSSNTKSLKIKNGNRNTTERKKVA